MHRCSWRHEHDLGYCNLMLASLRNACISCTLFTSHTPGEDNSPIWLWFPQVTLLLVHSHINNTQGMLGHDDVSE